MVGVDALRAETKALVFDQYGTVVDMQGGLTAAITGFLTAAVSATARTMPFG
jgi:hypothetical protein